MVSEIGNPSVTLIQLYYLAVKQVDIFSSFVAVNISLKKCLFLRCWASTLITMHSNTSIYKFLGNQLRTYKSKFMEKHNLVHVQLASSQSVFSTSSNEANCPTKPSYDPCKRLVQSVQHHVNQESDYR